MKKWLFSVLSSSIIISKPLYNFQTATLKKFITFHRQITNQKQEKKKYYYTASRSARSRMHNRTYHPAVNIQWLKVTPRHYRGEWKLFSETFPGAVALRSYPIKQKVERRKQRPSVDNWTRGVQACLPAGGERKSSHACVSLFSCITLEGVPPAAS